MQQTATLQHGQHCTAQQHRQHNTAQHNTAQHNNNTAQHSTTHNTAQHNTTQHNTTQHNTAQHRLQHGMIANVTYVLFIKFYDRNVAIFSEKDKSK